MDPGFRRDDSRKADGYADVPVLFFIKDARYAISKALRHRLIDIVNPNPAGPRGAHADPMATINFINFTAAREATNIPQARTAV